MINHTEDELFDFQIKDTCGHYFEDVLFENPIIEYEIELNSDLDHYDSPKKGHSIIQWWDKEDVQTKVERLTKSGSVDKSWRIAHFDTAKMLYKYRNNPEAIVSIWIEASRRISKKFISLNVIEQTKAFEDYKKFITVLDKRKEKYNIYWGSQPD